MEPTDPSFTTETSTADFWWQTLLRDSEVDKGRFRGEQSVAKVDRPIQWAAVPVDPAINGMTWQHQGKNCPIKFALRGCTEICHDYIVCSDWLDSSPFFSCSERLDDKFEQSRIEEC